VGLTEHTLQQLLAETQALVLRSGAGAWYVGIGHVELVLQWLQSRGLRVEGLEGFTCDGSSIRPVESYVADLSELEPDAVAAVAARILADWSDAVAWVDLSPIAVG
jgi:hypothetical protein